MRRILMVLAVFLIANVARVDVVSAQPLPGDGNCWLCGSVEGPGGLYQPQCFGVQSGAFECHLDGYYPYLICWTEGTGCETSLSGAAGWIEEVVPCNTLDAGEPAWWDLASNGGAADNEEGNPLGFPSRSQLLAPLEELFENAAI